MLENAIFDEVDVEDVRVTLFGGPILRPTDRTFSRGDITIRLPEEFFKVVAYTDRADGLNKVKAFKLSQARLLTQLALPATLDLEDWAWAQITLDELEGDTGLRFSPALKALEVSFPATIAFARAPMRLILKRAGFFR